MRKGEELLELMTNDLGLSAKQNEQMKTLIVEYIKHVKEVKTQNAGNKEATKEALKPVRKKRNQRLKGILNEDQLAKFKANKESYKAAWKG